MTFIVNSKYNRERLARSSSRTMMSGVDHGSYCHRADKERIHFDLRHHARTLASSESYVERKADVTVGDSIADTT